MGTGCIFLNASMLRPPHIIHIILLTNLTFDKCIFPL